jgi:circadian clock protein KaiC
MTGSSRLSQEAREKAAMLVRQQEVERFARDRERKREALEARILALRKEFEIEEQEARKLGAEEVLREKAMEQDRAAMAISRKADAGNGSARANRVAAKGGR